MAADRDWKMKLIRFPQFLIRTWFFICMGGMLLLLVLLGGSIFFYQRIVTSTFEEVEHEALVEMHSIMHLEGAIPRVEDPLQNYLIYGNPAERENFNRMSLELDEAFKEVPVTIFYEEKVRESIRLGWEEWQKARPAAETLLALPHPVGDPTAAGTMKRFDAQIGYVMENIAQAHYISHQELKEMVESARVLREKVTFFMFSIFGVGVFLVIVCGIVLVRSILVPLRILEEGANHLGSGRLSHRVVLDNQDEMGQLAKTFNAMAEELEKSRAALQNLSIRDGLTGLYNHRVFNAMLADELVRSQRFNRPVSLMMLDIDHFKRVNDSHGHPAGDAVLKRLSERLGFQARSMDRVCRYGGEEFTVILPETELEAAAHVAERLRAAVETEPFDVNTGEPMRMTVSIGVAAFPKDGDSAPELLAAADQLLFVAKRAGRNRVCTSQPDAERKTRSR
jgi:two-component system cell cycle response regulator